MKTKKQQWLRPALVGLGIILMICMVDAARAQDLIVNDWTNDDGGTFGLDWVNTRSYIYNAAELSDDLGVFDPTQNSAGDPNAGSMYVTAEWPLYSDPNWNDSWNDIQFGFYTPPFNPTAYTTFNIAIKVDVANSSPAIDGSSYGAIELIINNPWTTIVGYQTLALTNGWQYFTGSFAGVPDETNSEAVVGFISNGGDSLTNTVSYWIGDITFTAAPTVFTNAPPLSLAKAPPAGLTSIASETAGTYQRQMIQTVNTNYSWNTATAKGTTTTYSMTIASFPSPIYSGFEDQMFLIPQLGMIPGASVDYYSSNVLDFFVDENPDGSAVGTLQYKVNESTWDTTAMSVSQSCASGPLGTWTLTFNNNTNITITAPDNSSSSYIMPPSDAANFQDPLSVYVGTLPNNNSNIGQSSTFSQVQVSGSAGTINDTFTSLNTNNWELYAEDPSGVFVTTTDSKYWLTWPQPDTGFTNVFATDNIKNSIANSQWLPLPSSATGWINLGGSKRLAVINQSTLNAAFGYAPTNCFLQLYHP